MTSLAQIAADPRVAAIESRGYHAKSDMGVLLAERKVLLQLLRFADSQLQTVTDALIEIQSAGAQISLSDVADGATGASPALVAKS
ncbi:MAG: hypothetical protein JWO62_1650 [Acidimicrobiaceae bacterium]|nr:hypothetical protein [Acidimicrobiaceae bacterium]